MGLGVGGKIGLLMTSLSNVNINKDHFIASGALTGLGKYLVVNYLLGHTLSCSNIDKKCTLAQQ